MQKPAIIDVNSPAVIAHVGTVQAVISRMAANSASCKTWCITLVSAILVLTTDKGKPAYSLIAVMQTLIFLFVDTYYLALERSFRGGYENFLKRLHQEDFVPNDLYQIKMDGKLFDHFIRSLLSPSIYLFYVGLLALIVFANLVIA